MEPRGRLRLPAEHGPEDRRMPICRSQEMSRQLRRCQCNEESLAVLFPVHPIVIALKPGFLKAVSYNPVFLASPRMRCQAITISPSIRNKFHADNLTHA